MIGSNRTARVAQLLLAILIAAVLAPLPTAATRLPDTVLYDPLRDAPAEATQPQTHQRFRLLPAHPGEYGTSKWTYDPALQNFVQPDPLGYVDSHNLFQGLGYSGLNVLDPMGLAGMTGYAAINQSWSQEYQDSVNREMERHYRRRVQRYLEELDLFLLRTLPRVQKLFEYRHEFRHDKLRKILEEDPFSSGWSREQMLDFSSKVLGSNPDSPRVQVMQAVSRNEEALTLALKIFAFVIEFPMGAIGAEANMAVHLAAQRWGIRELALETRLLHNSSRFAPGRGTQELATWVDEGGNLRAGNSPGMRPNAYKYQSGVTGARSNLLTGRGQAPYLEFTDSAGNTVGAKFDGLSGMEIIDRKLNPFFSPKAADQASRQAAVAQHYGLQAVWELPTPEAVNAANRFLQANNISGITVRLKP